MCTATMTATASPPPGDDRSDFVSLAEVARILKRHVNAIKSIALAGGIRTRWLPGDRIRYSRSDAQRLAESDSAA